MENKYKMYDKVVNDTIFYFYIYAKKLDYITLCNFNPKDDAHMYIYSVAQIARNILGKKMVKVHLSPIRFLFFRLKHRYDDILREKKNVGIDCKELVYTYHDLQNGEEKVSLADIYNAYYKRKKV